MILKDFRFLSAPPADAIASRATKVVELKKQLGHKYILSKSLPRVK